MQKGYRFLPLVSSPRVNVAGYRNGYYAEEEEPDIAEMVRKSNADILFVGFSSPKKAMFLNRWMPMMQVPFCMGVGGGFDIIAGRTKRAPAWMQKSGMEWFIGYTRSRGGCGSDTQLQIRCLRGWW